MSLFVSPNNQNTARSRLYEKIGCAKSICGDDYETGDSRSFGSINVRVASRGNFAAGRQPCPILQILVLLRITGISARRSGAPAILARNAASGARPTSPHLYPRLPGATERDLVALCKPCHAEIHWRQPANDNQLQLSFDFPSMQED
jgi:hypothetical protein